MERIWRASFIVLFGLILSSAPAQDQGVPTALLVGFPDAPIPWRTCSGPRTIKVTAIYSSGRAAPYNGVGYAKSPSDAKCSANGMEIPIINGVGALPNSVVWYKPGENLVQVSTKDGALKGEAKAVIEAQDKDIKLEIEKPEPKPGHLWAGSVFKARLRATANGKPVDDLLLKALDSKGVIISPQALVTDPNGIVECEIFTPNFVCATTPNGDGTLEGDARLTAKFFVDANGDNTATNGEPQNGFDEIPIVQPCPQELIPCALVLCRILAEGGVIEPGPVLGPTPASVAKQALTRKPDKEQAERAILRDACRFLEDQVIGFINLGKWDGRFSDVVKRLEHLIKFLRPAERAKLVTDRLQCAADILRKNPDVKDIRLSIEDGRGVPRVPIGVKETIEVELIGALKKPVTAFERCTQPELREVKASGPGTATSVKARDLEFDYECLGPGPVRLALDMLFALREVIIIEDGGRVDSKLVARTANEAISPLSLNFLLSFRKLVRQDPKGPDIEVFQPRSTAKNQKIPDDEEDTPGAFTIANLDDDNNNKSP